MRSVWGEFIRMIFVTTGSQKFQFNRLLQKIDLLIEEGMIREEVFAQIGVSDYQPKHYEYCRFLDREGFLPATGSMWTIIRYSCFGNSTE